MTSVSPQGGYKLDVRVSDAIPPGEAWLTSGCSWTETRPGFPHGKPG